MSEKAIGFDKENQSILTLQHATGNDLVKNNYSLIERHMGEKETEAVVIRAARKRAVPGTLDSSSTPKQQCI